MAGRAPLLKAVTAGSAVLAPSIAPRLPSEVRPDEGTLKKEDLARIASGCLLIALGACIQFFSDSPVAAKQCNVGSP
jgi:hypothetical protein